MTVTVTAHPNDLRAASAVLNRSIARGDWDQEAEAMFATAAGKLSKAVQDATKSGAETASATMGSELADEVAAILECDSAADTTLSGALTAFYAGLSEADGFE